MHASGMDTISKGRLADEEVNQHALIGAIRREDTSGVDAISKGERPWSIGNGSLNLIEGRSREIEGRYVTSESDSDHGMAFFGGT